LTVKWRCIYTHRSIADNTHNSNPYITIIYHMTYSNRQTLVDRRLPSNYQVTNQIMPTSCVLAREA